MSNAEVIEKQLRKLRRRIEDFLRHTTPDILIRIADICKINVPKTLRDRYGEKKHDWVILRIKSIVLSLVDADTTFIHLFE